MSEKIDQVVLGRRYIIAEIGKLKVSVEDFKGAIEKANFQSIADAVNEMKNFMQMAVSSLGQLKSTLTQLGNTVANLSTTVDDTLASVNQLKTRGPIGAPAPAAGIPAAPTPSRAAAPAFPKPFGGVPAGGATFPPAPAFGSTPPPPTPSGGGMPSFPAPPGPTPTASAAPATPAASAAPAPAPAPAPAAAGPVNRFDKIFNDAKAGTTAKDVGVALDTLRSALSKENPLNPILFELSMEAGRLKSLGGKTLTGADLSGLEIKVNSWKAKSGG